MEIIEKLWKNMTNAFNIGDVVQLKSGGPLLTVSSVAESGTAVQVTFFNPVAGTIANAVIDVRVLRFASDRPEVPGDAARLRSTSVAKSTL